MSEFYDNMAATTYRLLTKFGFDVVLRKKAVGGGGYNPRTSGTNNPVPADETRKALKSDNPGSRIGKQYGETTDGQKQKDEKWVYLDAKGRRPAVQDEVVMNNFTYVIVDVQEIAPGNQALMYLVVLHR